MLKKSFTESQSLKINLEECAFTEVTRVSGFTGPSNASLVVCSNSSVALLDFEGGCYKYKASVLGNIRLREEKSIHSVEQSKNFIILQEFKTNNLYVYNGITGVPVTELKGDPSDYNGTSFLMQTLRKA